MKSDTASGMERCEAGGEAVPVPAEHSAPFRQKGLRGGIDGKIRGYRRCPQGAQS